LKSFILFSVFHAQSKIEIFGCDTHAEFLCCFDAYNFTKAADMHKKAGQNYSMPCSKAI
jgi:hypothetical protein